MLGLHSPNLSDAQNGINFMNIQVIFLVENLPLTTFYYFLLKFLIEKMFLKYWSIAVLFHVRDIKNQCACVNGPIQTYGLRALQGTEK